MVLLAYFGKSRAEPKCKGRSVINLLCWSFTMWITIRAARALCPSSALKVPNWSSNRKAEVGVRGAAHPGGGSRRYPGKREWRVRWKESWGRGALVRWVVRGWARAGAGFSDGGCMGPGRLQSLKQHPLYPCGVSIMTHPPGAVISYLPGNRRAQSSVPWGLEDTWWCWHCSLATKEE